MAEGYKAWSGGQVLNAADLTDYASSQAVMRFANAAGRDAALTVSVVKEGMLAYLKDSNILTVNTDGTTGGWVQIYPVITSGITDSQVTNGKLAAASVSSTNIIDGTITGTDIASATITGSNIAASTITSSNILDGTITGTDIASGTITGANIQDGSIGTADLAAGTYAIDISGNAATATNATNADTVDGYHANISYATSQAVVRDTNGAIYVGDVSNFSGNGRYAVTTASSYWVAYQGTLATTLFRVDSTLGVYSTVVSGRTVLVNSNGTLGTSSSSERYKEDITPAQIDPAAVLQLEPVTFRYKASTLENDAERPVEIGLIAERVADAGLEELLYRDKDGRPDGVAYEKLAVYLLGVCKDLSARLEALEATNAH
jgi:hypothetical protein